MKAKQNVSRKARKHLSMFSVAFLWFLFALYSNAGAQWTVNPGTCTAINLQFPSAGNVSLGAAIPGTYISPYMFEVFGITRFGGNSIIDNGNLTLTNGNLSVTGNGTFFPNGGVAPILTLWNAGNTKFTAFQSVATSNITYSLPPSDGTAGQVLSTNGAGILNWSSAAGNVTTVAHGTPTYIPMWTTGTNLENSIAQQLVVGGNKIIDISPAGALVAPATGDLFENQGNMRLGGVYALPPNNATLSNAALTFSGVPGTWGPIPTVDGDNTDIIKFQRNNIGQDKSELRLSIGDNPEGMPTALAGPPPFLSVTPDYFTIGATNGGYQQMFSFSTDARLSIGLNVVNKNALDVGFNLVAGGGTAPDNAATANVAIGQGYAGTVAAPINGLLCKGNMGVGTTFNVTLPGNQLEVRADPALGNLAGVSGLRLTDLAGGVSTTPVYGKVLSVNAAGDVILVPGGGSLTGTGSNHYVPVWTGTSTLSYDILYDDGTSKIGINTTSPSSNLSFGDDYANGKTIGVEQTSSSNAGTALTVSAGDAHHSTGSNLAGGDLTLSSGLSAGTGKSNIVFQTASGTTGDHTPSTTMYLAGNGKLGIGATASTSFSSSSLPSKDLSIDGNTGRTIWMERYVGNSAGRDLTIQAGGCTAATSSTSRAGGNLYLSAGISVGNSGSDGTIFFQTPTDAAGAGTADNTPTTKMRITRSGTVGINVSSPSYTLEVDDVAGGNGTINATGNIYVNGTAVLTSDERLKTDIKPIQSPIDKIMNLRGVEYYFKNDLPDIHLSKNHQVGVIAQEVQKVLPEAVFLRHDGYYGVSYEMLVPLLIEGVKEQQNEITAKDQQISDLNARLTKLEAAVFALSSNSGSFKTGTSTQSGDEVIFYQNNPNPFSNSTTISYHLPQTVANANLVVMSSNGVEVLRIPLEASGNGTAVITADKLASGQYFYTIIADGLQAQSKTMTVIK